MDKVDAVRWHAGVTDHDIPMNDEVPKLQNFFHGFLPEAMESRDVITII